LTVFTVNVVFTQVAAGWSAGSYLGEYYHIIIMIIIFINCNWVITRWQCLLYMSANMKMVRANMKMVNTKFKTGGYMRSM